MNSNDIRSYNILKRLGFVNLIKKAIIFKDSGVKGLSNNIKEKKLRKKFNLKNGEVLTSRTNLKLKIGYIDVILETGEMYEKVKRYFENENVVYYSFDGYSTKTIKVNDYDFRKLFVNRSFIYITRKKYDMRDFRLGFNILYDELVKISELLNSFEGLKLYSNYNQTENITVKTSTFFNDLGTNYYSGGAERYLLDLFEVCNELGFNLDIYQNATIPFFRKYNNINVIGMKPNNIKNLYNLDYLDNQTKNYIYQTKFKSVLHIYSAFQECFPNHIGPSIGISHGVSWDNKSNNYKDGVEFWNSNITFIEGAKMCDKLVSVDTNTANWFQTINYDLGNKKFHVIPNYVDNVEFSPRKDYFKKREKIIITYPRRLYEARGLYIALDVVDDILEKYDNVEFHFVGKGFKEDLDKVEEKIKKYNGRVKCYNKSPYEMHEVYKMSDISLIPTQYSEGTSLSCLEAMSSGNIVIATRIGGLTDLIISGYNGYLIEPDKNSLREALIKILDNFEGHSEMRKNAIKVSETFNKQSWKESWKKVILSMNIKGKSKTNDLVVFNIGKIECINDKKITQIKDELKKGNLVYLKGDFENMENSNLLQFVPMDEEIVSKPIREY